MGYYIETSNSRNKAQYLISNHGAQRISPSKAGLMVNDQNKAIICVVDNGTFEAAAYIYDENEYEAFNWEHDNRIKTWLVMNKALAEQLCNYRKASDPR